MDVDSKPLYNTTTRTASQRKTKIQPVNPIEAAITSWFATLPEELVETLGLSIEGLLVAAPRRWVVYSPMLLLPSGSFAGIFLSPKLDVKHTNTLWTQILDRVGRKEGKGVLTHLAINSGIPLRMTKDEDEGENILRSPSGLIMLYGDFGPALRPDHAPSATDFAQAFWVRTKQNGITQVWAPRYTMFSRGNVKEKARLLEFHNSRGPEQEEQDGQRVVGKEELRTRGAVDLYAGIGYFVFSYAKMGIGKVLGWELNPWSVEGLRRGAVANGWGMRVVGEGEVWVGGEEKIVAFLEDNRRAAARLSAMDEGWSITHVNGGLLPTSEASWEMSLSLLGASGWLHLHENVGVEDVERRKVEIEDMFRGWLIKREDERKANVVHVEFVKTFAPGVWHCVFDVYIRKPLAKHI